MTRAAKSGRVTAKGTQPEGQYEIPSYRKRHPVVYGVVILAVVAMVLATVAIPLSQLF